MNHRKILHCHITYRALEIMPAHERFNTISI